MPEYIAESVPFVAENSCGAAERPFNAAGRISPTATQPLGSVRQPSGSPENVVFQASGTSGMLFSTSSTQEVFPQRVNTRDPAMSGTSAVGVKDNPQTVPDVPDAPNPAGFTSDRTAGREEPSATEPAEAEPTADAYRRASTAVRVPGHVYVRAMLQRHEDVEPLDNPILADLLAMDNLTVDTVIEFAGDVTVLDADAHHWTVPPTAAQAMAYLADVKHDADAGWVTHGGGFKLVFVGSGHRERALAAALSVPKAFRVEIIKTARHPRSASSSARHCGRACGPVQLFDRDPSRPFTLRGHGLLTPEARDAALEALGMEPGGRYDHGRCPIDPCSSEAAGCVHVLDGGVFCHRCAGHGVRHRPYLRPGFYPFPGGNDVDFTSIDRLVSGRVHWTHAQHELARDHANLGDELRRELYRLALEERYGAYDPRVNGVFNKSLDFVRGQIGWLDTNLYPTAVDKDVATCLPAVQYLDEKSDGEPVIKVDKAKQSQAVHRMLPGYTPIMPYRGLLLDGADGYLHVPMPSTTKFTFELSTDPLSEVEIREALQAPFPGLDYNYLVVLLVAAFCAPHEAGLLPMIMVTGPTGSGKNATLRLAASLLGKTADKIPLEKDREDFLRAVCTTTVQGCGFLNIDEFGKNADLHKTWQHLLELAPETSYRDLFGKVRKTARLTAPLVMTTILVPPFLADSPEFSRRVRQYPLARRVPDWRSTAGGDVARWRDRTEENARVGNSLLAHVHELCRRNGFSFGDTCDSLGVGHLGGAGGGLDQDLLLELYQYARGERGDRVFFKKDDRKFSKGWIDLTTGQAKHILGELLPINSDDNERLSEYQKRVANDLGAASWNDVLGIDTPVIGIETLRHGNKWGFRFRGNPGQTVFRGTEVLNEQLPAAQNGLTPKEAAADPPASTPKGDDLELADQALREGGLL